MMYNINPTRYRSYYYDKETNLYYLNNRYYDPKVMRFISIDDIEYLDYETLGGILGSILTNLIDGKNVDLKLASFSGLVGFTFSIIPLSVFINSKLSKVVADCLTLLDVEVYGYSLISSLISAVMANLFGDKS